MIIYEYRPALSDDVLRLDGIKTLTSTIFDPAYFGGILRNRVFHILAAGMCGGQMLIRLLFVIGVLVKDQNFFFRHWEKEINYEY